jgi:hypothetical protein
LIPRNSSGQRTIASAAEPYCFSVCRCACGRASRQGSRRPRARRLVAGSHAVYLAWLERPSSFRSPSARSVVNARVGRLVAPARGVGSRTDRAFGSLTSDGRVHGSPPGRARAFRRSGAARCARLSGARAGCRAARSRVCRPRTLCVRYGNIHRIFPATCLLLVRLSATSAAGAQPESLRRLCIAALQWSYRSVGRA